MPKSLLILLSLLGLAGCIDVYSQPKPQPTTIVTPPPSSGPVYVPPGGTVVTPRP